MRVPGLPKSGKARIMMNLSELNVFLRHEEFKIENTNSTTLSNGFNRFEEGCPLLDPLL